MDSTSTILMFNYPSPNLNCTLTLTCNSGAVIVNNIKLSTYNAAAVSSLGKFCYSPNTMTKYQFYQG